MAKKFTWIPLYRELAATVLQYEDRQPELVAILREIKDRGITIFSMDDKDQNDNTIPLHAVDPFTFFAAFNRGISLTQRFQILAFLKDRFSLQEPVPIDLDSIPIMNNQNSWFFAYAPKRKEGDIEALWALAKEAVVKAPADMDPDVFSRALDIHMVAYPKLTIGLYWLAPETFVALDGVNEAYCAKHGVDFSNTPVESLTDYLDIRQQIMDHVSDSFPDLSHAAYLDSITPPLPMSQVEEGFRRLLFSTAEALGTSVEGFCEYFDPDAGPDANEMSNRVSTYPLIAAAAVASPLDPQALRRACAKSWPVASHAVEAAHLSAFVHDSLAEETIRALVDEESGVSAVSRVDAFVETVTSHGYADKKGNADASGAALLASVLLSAVAHDKHVEFRTGRWNTFWHLVMREKSALIQAGSRGVKVARVSAFARAISATPTFREHFGENHALWLVASLAWWFHGRDTRAWLFQCNPEKYDLPAALDAGVVDRWMVRQHKKDIQEGDPIILWCGGKLQGSYAICRATSGVEPMPDGPDASFWHDASEVGEVPQDRVRLQVVRSLATAPVTKAEIEAVPALAYLPIGKQGTNFDISTAQYVALHELATGHAAPQHWLISPGEQARFWDYCREHGAIRLGWNDVDEDLSAYRGEEQLTEAIVRKRGNDSTARGLVEFVQNMSVGDRIFVRRGRKTLLGYGRVTSDYHFDSALEEYRHYRRMEWTHTGEWELPEGATIFPRRTLCRFSDEERIEQLKLIVENTAPTVAQTVRQPVPGLPGLNVIYYGPPGTGKTFHLLKELVPHFVDDDGTERYAFVTFHQSYSYEDFVEGIRPVVRSAGESGELSYKVRPGVFRELVDLSRSDPSHNYAIFIDEISRANVAGVFGELITLIEEDKRAGCKNAVPAVLPYSRDPFSVPSNLYILGTMNTADRSVEALDSALRRRFCFEERTPDLSLVDKTIDGIDLAKLLGTINARIRGLLDKDHCIGHSYLMHAETLEDIRMAFANKIVPLLEEYFFGGPGRIGAVLGEAFVTEITTDVSYAAGAWGTEEFEDRRIHELVDSMTLTAEDFQSIYA